MKYFSWLEDLEKVSLFFAFPDTACTHALPLRISEPPPDSIENHLDERIHNQHYGLIG